MNKETNRVVTILMARDNLTEAEAIAKVIEVRDIIYSGIGYDEAEDLLRDELGLEMDYLVDIV